MKLKTTIFAVALTVLSAAAFASDNANGDPVIKILPSPEANVLKLLYVNDMDGTVQVKFYEGSALVKKDKIKEKDFEKGFIKRYDLSELKAGIYQVEIISEGMSVKYELSVNPGQPLWARSWSGHMPAGQAIASK
ncbi:MAG: hypothetical protein AAF149_09200 [Bacteroidota bacterium]